MGRDNRRWQVWYCPQLDELVIQQYVGDPVDFFLSENIQSGRIVWVFYVGEL